MFPVLCSLLSIRRPSSVVSPMSLLCPMLAVLRSSFVCLSALACTSSIVVRRPFVAYLRSVIRHLSSAIHRCSRRRRRRPNLSTVAVVVSSSAALLPSVSLPCAINNSAVRRRYSIQPVEMYLSPFVGQTAPCMLCVVYVFMCARLHFYSSQHVYRPADAAWHYATPLHPLFT